MAKITVDEDACVGCGLCINGCSQVFELGDDGIAKVKSHTCSDGCNLREVASLCPVNAIVVED